MLISISVTLENWVRKTEEVSKLRSFLCLYKLAQDRYSLSVLQLFPCTQHEAGNVWSLGFSSILFQYILKLKNVDFVCHNSSSLLLCWPSLPPLLPATRRNIKLPRSPLSANRMSAT